MKGQTLPSWAWAHNGTTNWNGIGSPVGEGIAIATDPAGNVYITGWFAASSITFSPFTVSSSTYDPHHSIYIVKYNSAGVVQWVRSAGGNSIDEVKSISTDDVGNVYITGNFYSSNMQFGIISPPNPSGVSKMYAAKYDTNGNVLWVKTTDNAAGNSISVDPAGNAYVTGSFAASATFGSITLTGSSSNDIFVAKYDANGNALWAKKAINGANNCRGYSISVKSGAVYIAGNFQGNINFGSSSTSITGTGSILSMFIAKYSTDGTALWARNAAGVTKPSMSYSVCADACGNAYVTGFFSSPAITFGGYTLTNANPNGTYSSNQDIFITKYDGFGNVLWAKSAGGFYSDRGHSVSADNFGNVYLLGLFNHGPIPAPTTPVIFGPAVSLAPAADSGDPLCIIKYNGADGTALCGSVLRDGGGEDDDTGVSADAFGNAYVTGDYARPFLSLPTPPQGEYPFVAKYLSADYSAPILSLSASPAIICQGQSAALTAAGADSYTWSAGVTSTGTSTGNVTPSITTTYTVTGTTAGCASTAAATVTVNPTPAITVNSPTICRGLIASLVASGAATYTWSAGATSTGVNSAIAAPLTTTTYTVTGTLNGCSGTALATVTVDPACCAFASGGANPAIAISIPTTYTSTTFTNKNFTVNANITISGTVTFSGCDMHMGANVKFLLQPGAVLNIKKSAGRISHLYSCNNLWDGIYINGNTAALNITEGSLIEDALNAVVSTNGGNYFIENSALNNNYKHVVVQAYIGSHPGTIKGSSLTCTKTLKAPLTGKRTNVGVEIQSVSSIYVGYSGAANTFPNSNTNTFDNMDFGVMALSSNNVTVINNTFNNLKGAAAKLQGSAAPPLDPRFCHVTNPPVGTGVYAELCSGNAYEYYLNVGQDNSDTKNTFTECNRGVDAVDYGNVFVLGCDFKNASNTSLLIPVGDHAVYIKSMYKGLYFADVNNNTVENFNTGVHISNAAGVDGYIHINSNTITAKNTGKVTTGILTENSFGYSYDLMKNVEMTDNLITNITGNCIFANNMEFGINIHNNRSLVVKYKPAGSAAGIRAAGCLAPNITENADIRTTATALSSGSNTQLRGIYETMSPGSFVSCNGVSNFGQGLVFEGLMGATTVQANSMNNAVDGLVLLNNGVIGDQGWDGNPNDNVWSGTFYNSQTYTANTFNANIDSPFWVRAGGLYNPQKNITNSLSPSDKIIPKVSSGNPPVKTCGSTGCLDCQKIIFAGRVIKDSILYANNPAETRQLGRQMVFEQLKAKPMLMDGKPEMLAFYEQTQQENTGRLETVNEHIKNKEYTQALAENIAIAPTSAIETNHQTFNDIYIKTIGLGTSFTSSQITMLEGIASQCPLTDGKAVYQSRALLNLIYNDVIDFTDNCKASAARKMSNVTTNEKFNNEFKIYPNPNNGSMTLTYNIEGEGELQILDITGKLITKHALDNQTKSLEITDILENGIYYYTIIVNNGIVFTDKLVIIK